VWAFALLLPTLLAAQEAAGDVLIANDYLDTIVKVIGLVVVTLFGWVGKLLRARLAKAGVEEEIIDALETSVTKVYHTSYQSLKEKTKKKKLTRAEAAELRQEAYMLAKQELVGPAYDLLKSKGVDYASKIIENVIANFKSRKTADKTK